MQDSSSNPAPSSISELLDEINAEVAAIIEEYRAVLADGR